MTDLLNTKAIEQQPAAVPTDINEVWLEAILKKDIREEEVVKIVGLTKTAATVKGDNYTSNLTRVIMDTINGAGRNKKVSVLIKELPLTLYRRAMIGGMGIFLKEIVMYREILPAMIDIMEEFEDFSEPMWGKCLEYRPYDRLVLQDLSRIGYRMDDRKLGLDYPHCLLVVRSLAKFHALSCVLMSRGLIPLEIYDKGFLEHKFFKDHMFPYYEKMLLNFAKVIEEKWEPEWHSHAEKVRNLIPIIMTKTVDLIRRDEEGFNVLNHGDCWFNNMLFKKGIDSTTPIALKFVDFQLGFYNTPAYDLQYFLSTTPNYEVRCKHKANLIKAYHEALMNFLKMYDYKGNIITLDRIQEDLKKLSLISLTNGLMILPIILLERPEEMPDMEDMIKEHVTTNDFNLDWIPVGGDTYNLYIKLLLQEALDANQL